MEVTAKTTKVMIETIAIGAFIYTLLAGEDEKKEETKEETPSCSCHCSCSCNSHN